MKHTLYKALLLMYALVFLCISIDASAPLKEEKYTLLLMLYNETNPDRVQEYATCLQHNLALDYVEKIHVLYDTNGSEIVHNNPILRFLQENNITVTFIRSRATFQDFFTIANAWYPNKRIAIINADIFFDETLTLLNPIDISNLFITLTRWNIQKDGSPMRIEKCYNGQVNTLSQDAWIFQSPIRHIPEASSIRLGILDCDGGIAWAAKNAGLEVINPCFSVIAHHYHLSNIRHFTYHDKYQGPIMATPCIALP